MAPGTSRSEYEFVVVSGTCGTRFVENPGAPSYLENTVVIQNEPGIQEVRTAPSVRGLSGARGKEWALQGFDCFLFLAFFPCLYSCVCVSMVYIYTVYICMCISPKVLLFTLLRPPPFCP